MNTDELQKYILPALLLLFFVWRFVRFRLIRKKLPRLIQEGAIVVDVRSPGEYLGGAREGSLNIPLDQLDREASRLDPAKPIILCCASGTRSAMAAGILKRKGFKNVINAGPWRNTVL